jgi:hypothetical protein
MISGGTNAQLLSSLAAVLPHLCNPLVRLSLTLLRDSDRRQTQALGRQSIRPVLLSLRHVYQQTFSCSNPVTGGRGQARSSSVQAPSTQSCTGSTGTDILKLHPHIECRRLMPVHISLSARFTNDVAVSLTHGRDISMGRLQRTSILTLIRLRLDKGA